MKEYGLWLAFYNVLFILFACLGKWLDVNKKLLFEHDQELTIDVEILQNTERNFQTKPSEPEEENKVPNYKKEIQMTETKFKKDRNANLVVDPENIKVEKKVSFEENKSD